MADQIRREDIIDEGALKAPLEMRDNLLQIIPALNQIIEGMGAMEKRLSSASSVTKLKSEINNLTKAQSDLTAAQKTIVMSHNEVIEYEKKLAEETKKTGTVITEQEKAAHAAANAATAWGAAIQKTAKRSETASKQIQKGFIAEKGSLEELIQKRDQLKKYIDEEKRSQKEEAEALKMGNVTRAEYNEIINASNTRIAEYTLKLKDANKDIQTHIALEGKDAKAITGKNASLKVLEVALAKNRAAYAAMTGEQQRNSKEGQELLKIIQQQDKESKALSKSIGINNKEVGSYTESIKAALGPLGEFTGGFGQVGSSLSTMTSGMKNAARGANLLRVALLAIPIFALIGAISSLIAYFKGTEEGAQRLRIIMAAIGQVFASLKDLFIDAGKAIYEALSNPKQAAIDLWEAIKENIVNRIIGTIELFMALRDAGVSAFTLIKEKIKGLWGNEDEEAVKKAKEDLVDAGKRASEAFIKAHTGVENFVDKAVAGFKKVGDLIDDISKKVDRAVELQKLENELLVRKRNFILEEAILQRNINKYREEAADSARTEESRLKAALHQREEMEKLEAERLGIAKQELYIATERAKLAKSSEDDLLHIKELQAEVVKIEAEGYAHRLRNTRQIAMLQIQIIERDKKAALDRIKVAEDAAVREGKARVKAVEEFITEEEKLIQDQYLAGKITREKAEFEIIKLRRNTNAQILQEQIDFMADMLKTTINTRDEEIRAVEEARDRRLAILKETYKDDPERYAEEEKIINEQTQTEIVRITEDANKEIQGINEETSKLFKKLKDSEVDVVANRYADEIRALTKVQQHYEDFSRAIGDLFGSITERRLQELDIEKEAIIKQREELLAHEEDMAARALAVEGLTEEQKQAIKASSKQRQLEIESEYQKKEEALEKKKLIAQRKAAVYEKAQAIVSALINTAVAVTKLLATPPLAAAAAALGAIQVAAIAARPLPAIPAAAEGIENHKGGPIRVSEEGVELIKYQSGKLGLTPARDSIINLERGASVIPHDETMRFLALQGLSNIRANDRVQPIDLKTTEGELRAIRKTIKNKREVIVQGRVTGERKNNTRIKYINSLRNA